MSIRDHIYQILAKIGEDPDREGLAAERERTHVDRVDETAAERDRHPAVRDGGRVVHRRPQRVEVARLDRIVDALDLPGVFPRHPGYGFS